MAYRVIRICSSYKLMHEEFETIPNTAIKNGYPESFIKRQIGKTLERYVNKMNDIKDVSSSKTTNNNIDTAKSREHYHHYRIPSV